MALLNNFLIRILFVAKIIYLGQIKMVSGLSCHEVKNAGSGSKYGLEELKSLSDDAFISCLVYLGRDPLGYREGKYMWNRLLDLNENDIWNISEEDLRQLGWIMKVITPKEMQNLTLADIDTIAAFGQYHNLSQVQLQALAEKVRQDWNAKDPMDYTFYDLMALNHILCGFNASELAQIHPDAYKKAAGTLSTLRDCPREQLEVLASLAISPLAFDEPSKWQFSQMRSVGCVINGMPKEEISSIPPEGFETLTPNVVECLSKETLKSMTLYQLKHLTPSAAGAVTNDQKSFLDFDRLRVIKQAYMREIIKKSADENNGSTIIILTIFDGFTWNKILSLTTLLFNIQIHKYV